MANCIFCARRPAKLTGEHLWSKWISKLLGSRKYTFREKDASGVIVKQSRSQSLSKKAPLVCHECNTQWMSQLENRKAKPVLKDMILNDSLRSILPQGIKAIAAFAFKGAVIANHMALHRGPFFTATQRRRFAKTLDIPDGAFMWIANRKSTPQAVAGTWKSLYGKTPRGTLNGFQLHIFTFGAGHFVIQVVSCKYTNRNLRKSKWPIPEQGDLANRFSIPLWPNDGKPILWPPYMLLTDNSIDAFCERWQKNMKLVYVASNPIT